MKEGKDKQMDAKVKRLVMSYMQAYAQDEL